MSFSNIEGGHSGTGNINTDPAFVGGTNYRLTSSSPCIDSGTSASAPDIDIDGNPRPQGSGYDMGAYEFVPPAAPSVATTAVSSITNKSAISGGNVSSVGSAAVTSRGVCWGMSVNPTINNSLTSDGSGSGTFSSNLTGLIPETSYHVRAYATNSVGTSYGNDLSFTTCPNCSGSVVTIDNVIFSPGCICECSGMVSITIGAGVTIPSGAKVTFKAPTIKVMPGFHAETGAVVNMRGE